MDSSLQLATCVLVTAAALSAPQVAMADDYPSRYVEVVVPTPAGASSDIVLRVLTEAFGASLGKPLVLNYSPSAGGIVGTEKIARAKPDGYTIGVASSSHPSLPFLFANFKLDPVKDFTPICLLGRSPIVALINTSFPATSSREFVAQVRANPKKYNYAIHSGQVELDFGSLAKLGNMDMVGVQYRGGPQAITGVLGNEVQVMITGLPSAKPFMDSGRLRAIAISSGETFPGLASVENLPLLSDEVPGYRGSSAWWGLIGPPGMPEPIVKKLSDACHAAVSNKTSVEKLAQLFILPAAGGARELADRIAADVENTRKQSLQTGVLPR